jgi:nucleotide-binding universal stress UspA family protein
MLPPRRILAPVDFSPYSATSLTFAARLAQQCGAELDVLHVQSPLLAAVAPTQHVDLQGETRVALAALMIDTLPPDDGERIHHVNHVETGPAVETICAAAATSRADLIVMGPRGRSRLAATLLGSTTQDVLQRAPCPVAVVPGTWTPVAGGSGGDTGTTAIVLGIENADAPSEALLGDAARLALALGAWLHVVHAVDSTDPAEIERRRAALTYHLQAHPVALRTAVHVEHGPAPDVLEAYASRAALGRGIVMLGAHGQSGRSGVLAGWHDTALSLMARLPLPFVACRHEPRG